MTDRQVVVLAGGLTHERDVSLRSGSRIADALRRQGVAVTVRDADSALLPWLTENRPDAAVIALHGGRGENGAVQGLLEMAGIPFVGSRSHECRLAWDKPTAKTLLSRAGVPTPDWFVLAHNTFRDLGAPAVMDRLIDFLGAPMMLKPIQGGSALGTAVAREAADVPSALVQAFAYGDVVLAERYVTGTELAITVVDTGSGPRALPAVEVVPDSGVFDYESRYTAGLTTYWTPARLPDGTASAAADLAVSVHERLGLLDVSRTDAIADADGVLHFLEVNVSPGLTETSMLPMAVEAAGEDLGGLYSTLIEQAIARG
jgi:D-alanine-D-alanine ligase